MKIKELLTLREAPQEESFEAYIDRLQAMGLNPLGNGTNSYVFKHPTLPNVAVKIFLDDDRGYRDYLEFCIKHPSNKYCPKVFETDEFSEQRRTKYFTKELHANWNVARSDNEPYSITFLEKLDPITNEAMDSMFERLGKIAGKKLGALANLGADGWTAIAADGNDHDLQQLAQYFVSELKNGHKLDMGNRKNFCLRGDQFVFIDPFF
jgi:hypothetical protein